MGKKADFVLLEKNPLKKIDHTKQVVGVMAEGRWFDRAALDGMLKNAEEDVGKY